MKKPNIRKFHGVLLLTLLTFGLNSFGQTIFDQAAVADYNVGANSVDKSATVFPNDVTAFSNSVFAAYANEAGGVINLASAVAANTTVFRATYGPSNSKRLSVTSNRVMQNVGMPPAGSFTPTSPSAATTSAADQTSINLTIGPITDPLTDAELLSESVKQIGITILSRTHATQYPSDIRVTASFTDGTTQSATANVGNVRGTDDTFFGFTAPDDQSITNLLLECFVPGTETPRATRICFDDLAFITSLTGFLPPPQIVNVNPLAYTIVDPAAGIQFEARSVTNIPPSGISLILNSTDVSANLNISGDATNRLVSYSGLTADQTYVSIMTVSNEAGVLSVTNRFYTHQTNFLIYDSGGFSDGNIFVVGQPLGGFDVQPVVHGESTWFPSTEASEVVDLGDAHGVVLRRTQTGNDQTDLLQFPYLANGILTISLDARVSNPNARTLDLCLLPASGGSMASFLAFGTNANMLSYFDGSAWVGLTNIDAEWHHLDITNYLSGPNRGHFDLSVDGTLVGDKLVWRHVIPEGTAFGRLRVGAIRGALLGEYGEVDNIVIGGAPAPIVALPATILNPSHGGSAFSFSFVSQNGFNHVVEYKDSLDAGTWTTLTNFPGDGLEKVITDNNLNGSARFYRVQTQ
jgi:hypothetical protein